MLCNLVAITANFVNNSSYKCKTVIIFSNRVIRPSKVRFPFPPACFIENATKLYNIAISSHRFSNIHKIFIIVLMRFFELISQSQ